MAIKMVERCVSNFATIGRGHGTSAQVKRRNKWMSKAAYGAALSSDTYSDWHQITTNEHEQELRESWYKLVAAKGRISVEEAFELYSKPFVTILKTENTALRKVRREDGHRRYSLAGIEVGTAVGLWTRGKLAKPVPEWSPRFPD